MIFTARLCEIRHGPLDIEGCLMNRARDWYKSLFEKLRV